MRQQKLSIGPIHIIIVTWNALPYTMKALKSLFDYTDVPFYLTIVDNGSSDGTQRYITDLKSPEMCVELRLIANEDNVGYGEAVNQAYKLRKCKYVCVANNDVYFSPQWLSNMIEVVENDSEIGILGPMRPVPWCKHPYADMSTDKVLENQEFTLDPGDELRDFCLSRDYETFIKDVLSVNNFGVRYFTGPPIQIVTCCAIVRSEIIDKVGGFSASEFKIYGAEDTDLSWRINAGGYKLAVTSKAYVHHFKHKSADASNLKRLEYCRINNEVFYDKWHLTLQEFLKSEITRGVDVRALLSSEDSYEYWFLRRFLENIGPDKFWNNVYK